MVLEEHGGPHILNSRAGELLNDNVSLIGTIQQNMNNMKVGDNVELLTQLRDNILTINEDMNNTPGVMSQMPQLPVQMDVNLANSILPPPRRMPSMSTMPMQQQNHGALKAGGQGTSDGGEVGGARRR